MVPLNARQWFPISMLFLRVELLALPGTQLQLPYHPRSRWQFPSQWVSKSVNTSLLQPSGSIRGSNYGDISKHMQPYLLFHISFKKESRPNTHYVGKQKQQLVGLTSFWGSWAKFRIMFYLCVNAITTIIFHILFPSRSWQNNCKLIWNASVAVCLLLLDDLLFHTWIHLVVSTVLLAVHIWRLPFVCAKLHSPSGVN